MFASGLYSFNHRQSHTVQKDSIGTLSGFTDLVAAYRDEPKGHILNTVANFGRADKFIKQIAGAFSYSLCQYNGPTPPVTEMLRHDCVGFNPLTN